jgi:hypothetical protein
LDGVPAQQIHGFVERGILDFEDIVKPHVDTFGPLFYTIQVADDLSIDAGTEIREGSIAVIRYVPISHCPENVHHSRFAPETRC